MKASKPQLTDEPSLTKKTKTSAITYQKRHTCLNTTHWFIGWNFAISRFVTIPGIRYGTQKPSTTLEVSEQKVPVCRAHWAHHFVPTPEFELNSLLNSTTALFAFWGLWLSCAYMYFVCLSFLVSFYKGRNLWSPGF